MATKHNRAYVRNLGDLVDFLNQFDRGTEVVFQAGEVGGIYFPYVALEGESILTGGKNIIVGALSKEELMRLEFSSEFDFARFYGLKD